MKYSDLKGELTKKKISLQSVAASLGIHPNSLSNKMKGDTFFSIEEAFTIKRLYFPDKDIKEIFKEKEED